MDTLQLDADAWDIGLDDTNNLAIATDDTATLQDACSAAQTWLGEVLYDRDMGVPYSDDLLSGHMDLAFYASDVESAVRQVPGVSSITCHLVAPTQNRQLTGLLAITINGQTNYVAF